MRSRTVDVPPGTGAAHGLAHGLAGIGEGPAARDAHLLATFREAPDGAHVWTQDPDGVLHLGRLAGPHREDRSAAARATGVVHVRPVDWLDRPFPPEEAPAGVVAAFRRGGRNFQRIRDPQAARATARLWDEHRG